MHETSYSAQSLCDCPPQASLLSQVTALASLGQVGLSVYSGSACLVTKQGFCLTRGPFQFLEPPRGQVPRYLGIPRRPSQTDSTLLYLVNSDRILGDM